MYLLHTYLLGAQAFSSATFGQGTVPIIMTNVMCSGTESQLAGCTHDGVPVQGCSHSKDAGVRCLSKHFVVASLLA